MEEQIKDELVAMLMRGERPEGMTYEDFKIKRKAIQKYIKQRNKGKLIHNSSETKVTKYGENNKPLEYETMGKTYKKS